MFKTKYGTKIIAIFIIILIIQGVTIGLFSYNYAEDVAIKNKQHDMEDMINLIDININIKVRYITELINNATYSQVVKNILYKQNQYTNTLDLEYFKTLDNSFGATHDIIIMDNKEIIHSWNSNQKTLVLKKQDVTKTNVYTKAISQPEKVHWLGICPTLIEIKDEKDYKDAQVITISKAIYNEEQEDIIGVMVVELDPITFSNLLLNHYNTFQNQYTFIIDENRNIVCNNKRVNNNWIDVIADQFDNMNRSFEMDLGDKNYFVCGQYNGVTGWKIFSAISLDYIYKQTTGLKTFIILCVLVSTFIISVVFTAISYTLTHPIYELTKAMKYVQEGDFNVQLNSSRKDEIGMLMNSFDFMIHKINILIKEVYLEKIAQKNAEMEALEAEINPHFLYNTLDCINWMLIDKGDFEVSEVIVSLGDLMKYCVNKNNSIVTLEEEINNIISYLLIQKTRLEDKLEYNINCPLYLKKIMVPKLILQPLVENAIIHGIEPNKKIGHLNIYIYKFGEDLHIEINDNGQGISENKLEELRENLILGGNNITSIGLYNVDKRLRLRYGDMYSLKIISNQFEGTKTTIYIPIREVK